MIGKKKPKALALTNDPGARAVLCQTLENYEALRKKFPELAKFFEGVPATCGENITVDGLPMSEVCVGDIFRVESDENYTSRLQLEVTSPRKPCVRMDQSHFSPLGTDGVKYHTLRTGLAGFFLRVITEGYLREGDLLVLHSRPYPGWTIERISRLLYGESGLSGKSKWTGTYKELKEAAAIKQMSPLHWRDDVLEHYKQQQIIVKRKRIRNSMIILSVAIPVIIIVAKISRKKIVNLSFFFTRVIIT
eukprot:NODE_4205_length_1207_cov_37.009225_g3706_i0.p1 GENE.NODE_4205_length_1207_cov_37.009225_g3706_i0~~NODE_4205_length_1207_cov_37.009225_g3706_i0.p1  ORF type:complete len:248 (-),score=28.14 NODE_4205_length_1207_cov_37.009225_g3706_i0:275-1018(-)